MPMTSPGKKKAMMGVTLIELLIGMAISAVVLLATSRLLISQYESYKSSQFLTKLEAAKTMIRSNIDCDQTMAVSPCPAGSVAQVAVLKSDGGELIGPVGATSLFKYENRSVEVLAMCNNANREIRFEYLPLEATLPSGWKSLFVVPKKCP